MIRLENKESSLKTIASLVTCAVLGLALTSAFSQSTSALQPEGQPQLTTHQPHELKVTEYRLTPDEMAKAEALYKIRTELYLFGMIFGIVVLWLMLKSRIAPAFRDLAEGASKSRFVQTLIFVPLFMLLIAIISLPVDVYWHHISRTY